MSIDQPNFEPRWSEFLQKTKDRALDDTRELWHNRAKENLQVLVDKKIITWQEASLVLEAIFKKD
jgi:hypothetical protein